ncbi:M48 family metallopeptidase [Candidatus Marinimicrobia bacterium]|nr:M48 family metallopeptidase [Candidatus Neomarinimicrobiota bacterium]
MNKIKIIIIVLFLFPLLSQEVVVNLQSGRIHNHDVIHLPSIELQKKYNLLIDAIKDGYDYCTSCFDLRPDLADYELERTIAHEAIINIKSRYEILYEHPKLNQIDLLMKKILEEWHEKLKGYNYRVQIIRDTSPNAFAIAGGNIYLTSGLIDMTEYSSELEAIIAHEISHIENRHTLKGFKDFQKKQMGLQAFVLLMSAASIYNGDANVQALGTIAALAANYALILSQKGFSRELEQEADIFAQLYLQQNNIPIFSFIAVLDKLSNYSKNRPDIVQAVNSFSDHPSIDNRIKQLSTGNLFNFNESLLISLSPKGIIYRKKIINSGLDDKEKSVLKSIKANDITIIFDKVYIASSSTKASFNEIILIGNIKNKSISSNFNIDKLEFDFKGNKIEANNIDQYDLMMNSDKNFMARLNVNKNISDAIQSKLISKEFTISNIIVSPIRKDVPLINRKIRISCSVIIK